MDKENLIKLLEQDNVDIKEITKDCSYIMTIDVGNMSKESIFKFCECIKNGLNKIGMDTDKVLLVPHSEAERLLEIFKVENGELCKI